MCSAIWYPRRLLNSCTDIDPSYLRPELYQAFLQQVGNGSIQESAYSKENFVIPKDLQDLALLSVQSS